ncbi:MAG: molybdopterin oxidoreductase family protein [Planctomycetota bacterium]|nr:MAG: molybdopterin oxidoreductase family protein [Planctomycetota bacterium]
MNSTRTLPSVCPLDCPDTCSLRITVDGARMVRVAGTPDHPITQGFACVKLARYPERQHHRDRLLYPLRRIGPKGAGRFETIDWDTALNCIVDQLARNIDRFGEQSVLPYCYAGTMGLIERDYPLAFFRGLGAAELDQTICAASGGAGWESVYGPHKMSTPPEEVPHARLIVLWGINAVRSSSHLIPLVKRAQAAGAHVLHIDPYRNETSRVADEFWQVQVGTDAALALALGGEILRLGGQDASYLAAHAVGLADYAEACQQWPVPRAAEFCGIPADAIRQLARRMVACPQTYIKIGYGMTRNEGGGNATAAIALLPALIGAWQHRGGGGGISTSGAFRLNTARYSGLHLRKPHRRVVNQNQLGRALEDTDQPISSLFVFNSNPAVVAPDSASVRRGLLRDDLFTVVLEHFQTDTADYADIVLPATTFVEHPDVYASYGHYHLQWAEPILPPPGDCRPNSWVFRELAARMGLSDPVFQMSTEELVEDLLDSRHPFLSGITWQRLRRERSVRLNLPEPFLPYAQGSNFPDGKIRFAPSPQQIDFREQPTDAFPLRLISPPGPFILNTTMGNVPSIIRAAGGEPVVLVHPQDAARSSVRHGDRARIRSRYGAIVRKVEVSDRARPGVVVALGQWWAKLAPDGRSLNELTSQELTDLGGGSLFGNPTVAVEPLDSDLDSPA